MMDLGSRCADIVVGAVLLGFWPGEHLAVAIPVFIGVSATPAQKQDQRRVALSMPDPEWRS